MGFCSEYAMNRADGKGMVAAIERIEEAAKNHKTAGRRGRQADREACEQMPLLSGVERSENVLR